MFFCFFKQKTAYEMRISDWSSDVCSSDLPVSRDTLAPSGKSPATILSIAQASLNSRQGPHYGVTVFSIRQASMSYWQKRQTLAVFLIVSAHCGHAMVSAAASAARGTSAACRRRSEGAHVCTPVTNAHLVCRLLLEKKNTMKRR